MAKLGELLVQAGAISVDQSGESDLRVYGGQVSARTKTGDTILRTDVLRSWPRHLGNAPMWRQMGLGNHHLTWHIVASRAQRNCDWRARTRAYLKLVVIFPPNLLNVVPQHLRC